MTLFALAMGACSSTSTGDRPLSDTGASVTSTGDTGEGDATTDTACVPVKEVFLDGTDQDCDGMEDEYGFGEPLSELSSILIGGDEEDEVYWFGVLVDVGFDQTGNQWLAVAGAWSGEFVSLDESLGDGLYVSTYFPYEYPMEAGVLIANWDGPSFVTVGWNSIRLFAGSGDVSPDDAVFELTNPALSSDAVDLDGDGVDELITGSPTQGLQARHGPTSYGLPDPYLVIEPGSGTSNFGWALGDVGDVTGDGVPEWTAFSEDEAGKVWFLPTALDGTFTNHDVGWHLDGETTGDDMGRVITLGDVNGDGHLDVATTAWMVNDQLGLGYVVHGPILETAPIGDVNAATFNGVFDHDTCGDEMGMVGDQDGDGAGELVVGCRPTQLPRRLELYAGPSLSGAVDYSDAARIIVTPGAWSVETREDVSGDGLRDVVIGAPGILLSDGEGFGAVVVVASPLL